MNARAATLLAGTVLVVLAAPAAGQQPKIIDAKLEQRSAAAGLERSVDALLASASQPAWTGYAVPAASRANWGTGQDGRSCTLQLEGRDHGSPGTSTGNTAPAGPRAVFVLYRLDGRQIDRIRAVSDDCQVDAGGLPFFWLTDVNPSESVTLLARLVRAPAAAGPGSAGLQSGRGAEGTAERSHQRNRQAAIAAIALHADPTADRALEQFVAAGEPPATRKDAAFWLGEARGRFGFDTLRRVVPGDADVGFRKQATFAVSVSPIPEAIDLLIRLAREDQAPEVRSQALFWVAQKAGQKAAGIITEAIEKDPDTDVKRRAVFALSRLPADEGVPRLIQVARSNANPAVRKQAFFWLGQSKDPRALAFFAEVLSR